MPGLPCRGQRSVMPVEGGEALLIDESYNANPLSMAATPKQLGREQAERRIAVLGGMRELGDRSRELHAGLVEPLTAGQVDYAVLVGVEMDPLAQALGGIMAFDHVPDVARAPAPIRNDMRTEERRVGKECVSKIKSRWLPAH